MPTRGFQVGRRNSAAWILSPAATQAISAYEARGTMRLVHGNVYQQVWRCRDPIVDQVRTLAPLAPLHGLGAALAARAAALSVSPEAQQMREQAMEVLADAVGLPAWDATLAAAAYASLVAAGATAGEQAEAAVVLFSAAAAASEEEEWCGVDSESMVRQRALYLLRRTIKPLHRCFMSQHALRVVAEAAFPPVSWIEVGPARSCFSRFFSRSGRRREESLSQARSRWWCWPAVSPAALYLSTCVDLSGVRKRHSTVQAAGRGITQSAREPLRELFEDVYRTQDRARIQCCVAQALPLATAHEWCVHVALNSVCVRRRPRAGLSWTMQPAALAT
jgi:hypothetical protein